ncbi:hypothetical protein JCM24511_01794 [Saitozyma sp. JCM 24511]|nr:hypothetical protein JCM24511_01794 [Saitozyma sp. JCM 24511]
MTTSPKPSVSPVAPVAPVAIIGAGPGGLVLARYLQIHSVPCVIYERETSASARGQGGSLDLHGDTGLEALRRTHLLDEARGLMRPEGDVLKIMDKTGKVLWDENKEGGVGATGATDADSMRGRPEIDRTDLRNLLLRSLLPDTVKWGYGVKSIAALNNDEYEITFINAQPPVVTSCLIGADGVWSRVRPLLHSSKPFYSGLTMYDMFIPPGDLTPEMQKYVGAGSALVLDDHKGILPQMNSGGKCVIYAAMQLPEAFLDANPLPEAGKKEVITKHFEDWHPINRELIMAADERSVTPRKIWSFDPELKWDSPLTGVTVIGDAAHVMSPFAGEGVNQAMADGMDLGQTLVKQYRHPRPSASLPPFPLSFLPVSPPVSSPPTLREPDRASLHRRLRAFERRMMRRASPEMRGALDNQKVAFGDDSAKKFTAMFKWFILGFVVDLVTAAPKRAFMNWWDSE